MEVTDAFSYLKNPSGFSIGNLTTDPTLLQLKVSILTYTLNSCPVAVSIPSYERYAVVGSSGFFSNGSLLLTLNSM